MKKATDELHNLVNFMHFTDVAADDCKKRWKTLRDNFAKAVRQEKSKRSGSAAEAKQKRTAVNRLLEFLEPYVSTRRSVTSNNMLYLAVGFALVLHFVFTYYV